MKFWSRRSIITSWEMRPEDISTSLAALNADSQPKLGEAVAQNETAGALPIPAPDSPAMADFVEFPALPQKAVVTTGAVEHWPSRSWRAEGRFAASCPNAAATMTYFQ